MIECTRLIARRRRRRRCCCRRSAKRVFESVVQPSEL